MTELVLDWIVRFIKIEVLYLIMIFKVLASFVLMVGFFSILMGLGKYTDIAPLKSTRSVAITPLVILSLVISVVAAVDGVGAAFMFMMVIVTVYVFGVVGSVFSNSISG